MTDPTLPRERRSFIRRRWPLLLVLLPLVLGAAVVAILGIGEYRCARGTGGDRPPARRGRTGR